MGNLEYKPLIIIPTLLTPAMTAVAVIAVLLLNTGNSCVAITNMMFSSPAADIVPGAAIDGTEAARRLSLGRSV